MSVDAALQRVRRIYAFWGEHPWLYRAQDVVTFLGRATRIRHSAIQAMGVSKGARVLEVACGTGRNFSFLEEAVGSEGQIVGFDFSQEMLDAAQELCRRRAWKNITLQQGDAAILDVGTQPFEGIVSILGISAIPGWEQALQRAFELLRPGARLVVCDARLFQGGLRFLNPLVAWIYRAFAAWDPTKNIPEQMKKIFGNVHIEYHNAGTFFIAASVKQ